LSKDNFIQHVGEIVSVSLAEIYKITKQ